ncbi:MAG: MFS transporter, partial [Verrucomicrobiales bacterium]
MVGILGGMWLGGLWFDHLLQSFNAATGTSAANAWRAALVPIGAIGAVALVPLIIGRAVRKTPAHPENRFNASVWLRHFTHLKYLFGQRALRLTALGISFYWFVAYFLGLVLVSFGKDLHPDLAAGGAATETSRMTAVIGVGLMLGSTLVSIMSRHRNHLGMVPFGGLGLTFGLLGTGLFEPGGPWFYVSLGFIGFSGGFYLVPLSAHLQDCAQEAHRGRILSANNLLTSFVGVLAIAAGLALDSLGTSPSTQVLFFVAPMALASFAVARLLPRDFLFFPLSTLMRLSYRIRTRGLEHLPAEGGALVICNHMSYLDSFILSTACPRQIRFVIIARYGEIRSVAWFLRLFGAIFITPAKAREAIRLTVDALEEGHLVCLFPEGQLSRTGLLNEFKKGFELVARQARVPVIPAAVDGLWGSIFSFEGGRFLGKMPRLCPRGLRVHFGKAIAPEAATAIGLREAVLGLAADAFRSRPEIHRTLGAALAGALVRKPWTTALIDRTGKRLELSRATLLASASTIARGWRRHAVFASDEARIGILLPLGAPALILECALVLAGKTPVILSLESTPEPGDLEAWGIRTVVSSEKVREHLPAFPWPSGFVDMAQSFRELSRGRLALAWIAAWILPAGPAARFFGRPHRGDNDPENEAIGLVQENIEEKHELVMLCHRQVLANVSQVAAANFLHCDDRILSEAPANTAAGNIFSLWLPLLEGYPLITLSLAARVDALLEAAGAEGATILLPGPTRWGALSHFEGEGAKSLRLAFCFDHLEAEEADAIEQALGLCLAPGFAEENYGVVLALSMEDPKAESSTRHHQAGSRSGSVGRLLPGIAP